MSIKQQSFTHEEKLVFALRELFENYGYRRYKMGRFEEYGLYAENKSFLQSENIVTFTDLNGRLMALKPDVTLSIVKNALSGDFSGDVRYHYNEEVFRSDKSTREIRRRMQVGIEHIGKIDLYSTVEAISLAKQSLAIVNSENLLDISHLGFVSGLIGDVDEAAKAKLLCCIKDKNVHELMRAARECSIEEYKAARLARLASLYGPLRETLGQAQSLIINDEMQQAAKELSAICGMLDGIGCLDNVNLDFSIVNDMDYYNGVIFQGYVKNVPTYVLSGGRYDRLIEKMSQKDYGAIGFAVYLDLIGLYDDEKADCDCDVLVLYNDDTDISKVVRTVSEFRAAGKKTLCVNGECNAIAKETIDLR